MRIVAVKSAVVAVVAAVAVATASYFIPSSHAATTRSCAYKSGPVLAIVIGFHQSASEFNGFCAVFNSQWHGRRFYGHFGLPRCEFLNAHDKLGLSFLTRGTEYGKAFCGFMTPRMRKLGYKRIK